MFTNQSFTPRSETWVDVLPPFFRAACVQIKNAITYRFTITKYLNNFFITLHSILHLDAEFLNAGRLLIVVFIRHAKSSWDTPNVADYQRPVAKRGLEDIDRVANEMKKKGLIPDLVVSSGAERALTTARGLVGILKPDLEVVVNDQLYFAGKKAVYGVVKETGNDVKTLFLVLHNPDINEIVLGDLGYDDDNVPTLGAALVRVKCDNWAEWKPKHAKVEELIKPKKL